MSKYIVSLENGRKFEFTAQAGLSQNEAVALLGNHLQQTEEAKEANTGFFSNLTSTLGQTDERAAAGISALMKGVGGANKYTKGLDEYVAKEEAEAYIPPEHRPAGFDEMVDSWKNPNVGIMDALGTSYDAIRSGTGRMVGGFAPAVAAGAFAPAGLPTLAASGLTLAATQHLPEAAAAQTAKHQEDIAAGLAPEGSAPDYNPAALLGASAANTALDMVAIGKSVPLIGKLLGLKGPKLQSEAAKFAAEQSITGAALKGLLKAEAIEIPQEVLQGVINRAAAGQDLTSPEAIAEMIETAKDVAISTPILGAVGGVSNRASAQREHAANQTALAGVERAKQYAAMNKAKSDEAALVASKTANMTSAEKIEFETNYQAEVKKNPLERWKVTDSVNRVTNIQRQDIAAAKKVKTETQAAENKWQEDFKTAEFADQVAAINAKVDAGATESELKKWKKWIKKADVDAESAEALRPLHKKVTEQLSALAEEKSEAKPTPTAHVTLDDISDDPDGTKLVNQTATYKKLLAEERTDEITLALDEHLTNHARKSDAVLRQYPNVNDIHVRADAIRAARNKSTTEDAVQGIGNTATGEGDNVADYTSAFDGAPADAVQGVGNTATGEGDNVADYTSAFDGDPAASKTPTTDETGEGQKGQTHAERMAETEATHTSFMEDYGLNTTHDPKDVEAATVAKEATLEKAKSKYETATEAENYADMEYFRELESNVQTELNAVGYHTLKAQKAEDTTAKPPTAKPPTAEDTTAKPPTAKPPTTGQLEEMIRAKYADDAKTGDAYVESLINSDEITDDQKERLRAFLVTRQTPAVDTESFEQTPAVDTESFEQRGAELTDAELKVQDEETDQAIIDAKKRSLAAAEKLENNPEYKKQVALKWGVLKNKTIKSTNSENPITIKQEDDGKWIRDDMPKARFEAARFAKVGGESNFNAHAALKDRKKAKGVAEAEAEAVKDDPNYKMGGTPSAVFLDDVAPIPDRPRVVYSRDMRAVNMAASVLRKAAAVPQSGDMFNEAITNMDRLVKAIKAHWTAPISDSFTVEDLKSLTEDLARVRRITNTAIRIDYSRYKASTKYAVDFNETRALDQLNEAERVALGQELASIKLKWDPNTYDRSIAAKTAAEQGAIDSRKLTQEQKAQIDKEAKATAKATAEKESTPIDRLTTIKQAAEKLGLWRRVTGDKVGPGFTVAEAKKIVDSFAKKKRLHKLNIQVVDTAENLPDNVKADIAGDLSGIHGAYKDDVIYIVADSHSSPAQVMETVAHEAMGHAGFARMFQKDYDRSVASLFRQLGGVIGVEKLAADLGVAEGLAPYVAEYKAAMQGTDQAAKKEAERMLTEELLAVAQGKEAVASLPTRIWNALKAHVRRMVNWMKSKGFSDIEQLDATDVHNILREMRDHSANTTLGKVADKAALASYEGYDVNNTSKTLDLDDPKVVKKALKEFDAVREREFDAATANAASNDEQSNIYSSLDTQQGVVRSVVKNKQVYKGWMDRFITKYADYSAGMSEDIRRGIESDMRAMAETDQESADAIGHMLQISTSQTVHDSAIGAQVLEHGGVYYETDAGGFQWKWVARSVDALGNKLATWFDLSDIIARASKNHANAGESATDARKRMDRVFTDYTTASRLQELHARNEELKAHLNALNEPDISTEAERTAAKDRLGVASKAAAIVFKNTKGVWEFKPHTIKKVHWVDENGDVDTARIEDTIATISGQVPEVREFVTTWEQLRDSVVETLVEGGLYSERQAKTIMDSAAYVPFFRDTQLLAKKGPQEYVDGLMVEAERQMRGSKSEVVNVLDNIERWVTHEVSRAVRNKSSNQLMKSAVAQGLGRELSKDEGSDVPNAVYSYVNGQKTYFQLRDANYVAAFTGMEGTMIPMYDWASQVTGLLRKNIVLNPLFALGQLTQDAFSAMLTSNLPFHQALKIPLKTITEFIATVGGTSSVHEELKKVGVVGARDWSAAAIRGDAESHAHIGKGTKWSGVLHHLENFSMASDNAVRQAVYSVAKDAGIPQREAVEKAFELINFRKHGASAKMQWAVRLVPFLGAALQSHHVLYKVMTSAGISPGDREAAQKQLLTNATMIIAISTAMAIMHGDDEDYGNANANTRSRSIYLGNDLWMPLRRDLFTLMFKSIPEEIYLNYTNSANVDSSSLRDTLSDGLLTAIGTPHIPQFAKPIGELLANKNLFTGRAIESVYMEGKDTDKKWTASTSVLGRAMSLGGTKLIGDAMLSPLQIDHLLRGYFGLTGATVMLLSRQVAKYDPGVEMARDLGIKDASLMPDIASTAFWRNIPGNQWAGKGEFGNREKTLMYDMMGKSREAHQKFIDWETETLNQNMLDPERRRRQNEKLKAWKKKYGRLDTKMLKNFSTSFNNIRRAKFNLMLTTHIPAAQYNRRFQRLEDQERQMMKRADTMGYRELVGLDEGLFVE